MARPSKKTIYERIESKKQEILNKEKELAELNKELEELYSDRDRQEMEKLFELMKANGLTIDKAAELLQSKNK